MPENGSVSPAPESLRGAGPAAFQRAVLMVKAGVSSAAVTLLVGSMTTTTLLQPPDPPDWLDLSTSRIDRMFAENRCSTTGFGAEQIPSRAMVRRESGRPAVVSFEEGWEVFTGDSPGRLMAVCLGPH